MSDGWSTVIHQRLTSTPTAPSRGRAAVAALEGRVSPEAMVAINLIVSELVSNSVRHGGLGSNDRIQLLVFMRPGCCRVEVRDPGPGFPAPNAPDHLGDSGWGLMLVGELASRWGVIQAPTCVWAEIDL